MGLFGSKKIFVSSTVRNLAGEIEDRPDYLKTVVTSNVLSGKQGMGTVIRDSYLNGPGIKTRSFYRWAARDDNYDEIGLPIANFRQGRLATSTEIDPIIADDIGTTVQTIDLFREPADFSYWAEQWMLANHQNEVVGTDWKNDIDPLTGEIVITRQDGSVHRFLPEDFDQGAEYLYAVYKRKSPRGQLSEGTYLWIYRIGSGNLVLDNLIEPTATTHKYFPFIPIRLENKFLSQTYYPDAYATSRRAFRRAFGRTSTYDKLVKKIAESESLKDIDHAYVVFAVPINTASESSKAYIWDFFDKIYVEGIASGKGTTIEGSAFDEWYDNAVEVDESLESQDEWSDLSVEDAPPVAVATQLPEDGFRIKAASNLPGRLDMEIRWNSIVRFENGSGLGKAGAKKGDIWFGASTIIQKPQRYLGLNNSVDQVTLYKQTDNAKWESMTFIGLRHFNHVYKHKSVEIALTEALEDAEESGFILPLNYDVIKKMSIIDATQLSTEASLILFNSYKVKKTGLLGSFIFKLVLAIVVFIVFNTVFPGSGGFAAAAVTAIGVTGIAALIITAAISVLAGMLVAAILTPIAKSIFGDKLGAIIGALATIALMAGAGNFANTGSFAINFGAMSTAQTLMTLTNAAVTAYSAYTGEVVKDTYGKIESMQKEFDKKSKEISALYAQNLGYGNASFNPLDLVSSASPFVETPDTFLSRTLLTGSDIAELSMSMLSNFCDITIDPNLPLQ